LRRSQYSEQFLVLRRRENWPGAAKAKQSGFQSKERAFAQGIFNSGAAIANYIDPSDCFSECLLLVEGDLHTHWFLVGFIVVNTLALHRQGAPGKSPLDSLRGA
jgi:hypothetical protein